MTRQLVFAFFIKAVPSLSADCSGAECVREDADASFLQMHGNSNMKTLDDTMVGDVGQINAATKQAQAVGFDQDDYMYYPRGRHMHYDDGENGYDYETENMRHRQIRHRWHVHHRHPIRFHDDDYAHDIWWRRQAEKDDDDYGDHWRSHMRDGHREPGRAFHESDDDYGDDWRNHMRNRHHEPRRGFHEDDDDDGEYEDFVHHRSRIAAHRDIDFSNKVLEDAFDTRDEAMEDAEDIHSHAVHRAAHIEHEAQEDAEDFRDFASDEMERQADKLAHVARHQARGTVVHAQRIAASTVAQAKRRAVHEYRGDSERELDDKMDDLIDAVDDAHADAHAARAAEHAAQRRNRMLEKTVGHDVQLRHVLGDLDHVETKLDDVKDEADDVIAIAHEKARREMFHANAAAEHIMEKAHEKLEQASEDAEDMRDMAEKVARDM